MTEISVKVMEDAFQDQEFEEKVLNCESKAELKELFASKGIEMSFLRTAWIRCPAESV